MPSVPPTSIDLSAAEVVADPYPYFAEERAAHPVAWHEPTQRWIMTVAWPTHFTHVRGDLPGPPAFRCRHTCR